MPLGRFNRFPYRGRYATVYQFGLNKPDLTKALLASLRSLNRASKKVILSVAGKKGEIPGSRELYVKVGWDDTFVAYSPSRYNMLCDAVAVQPRTTVDFALIVKYAYQTPPRRTVLRADEYWMRFNIGVGKFELQLHHFKGISRMAGRDVAVLFEEALINQLRQTSLPLDVELISEVDH